MLRRCERKNDAPPLEVEMPIPGAKLVGWALPTTRIGGHCPPYKSLRLCRGLSPSRNVPPKKIVSTADADWAGTYDFSSQFNETSSRPKVPLCVCHARVRTSMPTTPGSQKRTDHHTPARRRHRRAAISAVAQKLLAIALHLHRFVYEYA